MPEKLNLSIPSFSQSTKGEFLLFASQVLPQTLGIFKTDKDSACLLILSLITQCKKQTV